MFTTVNGFVWQTRLLGLKPENCLCVSCLSVLLSARTLVSLAILTRHAPSNQSYRLSRVPRRYVLKVKIASWRFRLWFSVTETNKGRFVWPRTMGSSRISLPCTLQNRFTLETPSSTSLPAFIEDRAAVAWHECSEKGAWDDLDDSACPYVSVSTKILEQAAVVRHASDFITL